MNMILDRITITIWLLLVVGPLTMAFVSICLSTKSWSKENQAYWSGCSIGGGMVIGFCYVDYYNLAHSSWTSAHPGLFWPVYLVAEVLKFLSFCFYGPALKLKSWRLGGLAAISVSALITILVCCFF